MSQPPNPEALRAAITAMEEVVEQRRSDRKKIEELRTIVEEKSHKLDATNAFVQHARTYVKDFPTEGILLKLERRMESVKDQVKQAERIASQHKAGIEAYYNRLRSNQQDLAVTLSSASEVLDDTLSLIVPLMQEELSIVGTNAVLNSCDALLSILGEREDELKTKCDEMAVIVTEERGLANAANQLQLSLEKAIPELEEEKQRDEQEIRESWEDESTALKTILNRLYTIHKEQAFHLQRGTHIKKDATSTTLKAGTCVESEIVLSTRHSHLAAEANKAKTTLIDMKEELSLSKKQIEVLKIKAREALTEYEEKRADKEARLAAAKRSHQSAVEENAELRDVKTKLYERLQELREVPQQTPRAIR